MTVSEQVCFNKSKVNDMERIKPEKKPARRSKSKKGQQLFFRRELSWLNFNERVLLEATDPTVPVIERLNFLGIFSNNMDEFFRVRVANLKRLANIKRGEDEPEPGFDPVKTLREVHRRSSALRSKADEIYKRICRELAAENIFFVNETELTEEQGVYVRQYFRETVRQHLFPIMLDRFRNYSSLHDDSIFLLIDLACKLDAAVEHLALIEIPTQLVPRFFVLPVGHDKRNLVMYLDDVIRYCLDDIFLVHGFTDFKAYTVKFTRDAGFDIDTDVSKSFIEAVSQGLRQRKHGDTVRFVLDKSMPKKVRESVLKKFNVKRGDTLEKGGRYHNARDLVQFPRSLGNKKMHYEPMAPIEVADFPRGLSMFDVIREKDVMLHYPYHSFQNIIELLREASIDPEVRTIKMTIYRAAKHSAIVNALINAARNGKEVIVFVEFQARFDEAANISWAGQMQEEGVRILPSIPGIKVHSKLLLIRRREHGGNMYYAAIGTGNPNENTTKIYCDEHLLTADKSITTEVNKVFHILDDQKYQQPDFKHIIVSPFGTRKFFIKMIDREIRNAKKGKPAWMIIKVNNLVDKKLINRLYEANSAGVKIALIVRGICALIPDKCENIRAIRIVDRFLEHSRIFVFCNDENPEYFIGSADWMERNLEQRFEVITPIKSPALRQQLWDILQIQLSDNVKARLLSATSPNERIIIPKNAKRIRAQVEIYRYLKKINEPKDSPEG